MSDSNNVGFQLEDQTAEGWERHLVPGASKYIARDFVSRIAVRPGMKVLDVACGTGVVTRLLQEKIIWTGKITAVDFNPHMLRVARQVMQYSHPPVEFIEAEASKIPLPDGQFDLVASMWGFQYFPDRMAALREWYRLAKPGARIIYALCRGIEFHPSWAALARSLDKHLSKEAGDIVRSIWQAKAVKPPVEHLRGSGEELTNGQSALQELSILTREAGFEDVHVENIVTPVRYGSVPEFVEWDFGSMPAPQGDLNRVKQAVIEDLIPQLSIYADDNGVCFPIWSWIVEARKPF